MKAKLFFAIGLISLLLAACGGTSPAPASDEIRAAPDFTLPNAFGENVSLSDYTGKPVFLFFHMAVG